MQNPEARTERPATAAQPRMLSGLLLSPRSSQLLCHALPSRCCALLHEVLSRASVRSKQQSSLLMRAEIAPGATTVFRSLMKSIHVRRSPIQCGGRSIAQDPNRECAREFQSGQATDGRCLR